MQSGAPRPTLLPCLVLAQPPLPAVSCLPPVRKPVSPKGSDLTLSGHHHHLGKGPSSLACLYHSRQRGRDLQLPFLSHLLPVLCIASQNADGSSSSDSLARSPPSSLLPILTPIPMTPVPLAQFPFKKKSCTLVTSNLDTNNLSSTFHYNLVAHTLRPPHKQFMASTQILSAGLPNM